MYWLLWLIALLSLPAHAASDLKTQIENQLSIGRLATLDVSGTPELAIFTNDLTGARQGGAILIHDIGAHLDWPQVIAPLRKTLPEYGWATLSVTCASLRVRTRPNDSDALFTDTSSMISQAVAFLRKQGINTIVVIGHGVGATVAAAFLANTPQSGLNAFIGISMDVSKQPNERFATTTYLEKLTLPTLDIYGDRGHDTVTKTANARRIAARKARATEPPRLGETTLERTTTSTQPSAQKQTEIVAYRQIVISGANHSFAEASDTLTKRVIGWLRRHVLRAAANQTDRQSNPAQ